jgi:8-oxo-dGTP diphosphatase
MIGPEHERPAAPRVAVGAIVFKEDKILLVKRNKPPGKGGWAIPGGSVNLGETLQQAAEREIQEETGLLIKAKDPVHTFDFIEREPTGQIRFHYVIVDLRADLIGGELRPSDDAADAAWFDPEEAGQADVNSATREFLRKIQFIR